VTSQKIECYTCNLAPFIQGKEKQDHSSSVLVLEFDQQLASKDIADQLLLSVGVPVYYIRRLRLVNQEPATLETTILPAYRLPQFHRFNLSECSLYAVLKSGYGLDVIQARQSFEAISASAHEAELLKIELGSPLMLEQRLAVDQCGKPIVYAEVRYRGDWFKVVTAMVVIE
jgi:GntR family transcriptional regulator